MEIKQQLAPLNPLLERPIDELVENAEPIRSVFHRLEGALPEDLSDALNKVSYIEAHRSIVLRARQRLAARKEQMNQASTLGDDRQQAKALKEEIANIKADSLSSQDQLIKLWTEREALAAALEAKDQEIKQTQDKLTQLPEILKQKEAALQSAIQKAKALKPIPGSAEADMNAIASADAIRQRALELLKKYLD